MKNKKLLICTTPLQMVIGEKILKETDGDWNLILLTKNNNAKYQFYYWKLSTSVTRNKFLKIMDGESSFRTLWNFIKICFHSLKMKGNYYDDIYLASIDNPFIFLIMSKLKYKRLFTFDDGSANINYEGKYHVAENLDWKVKIITKLFGNAYSQVRIKKESLLHYTLYDGKKNIIENTKYLRLSEGDTNNFSKNEISIFLGQPMKEVNERYDEVFVRTLLKKLGINFYFPHPRERKIGGTENVQIIKSHLIFEDFVFELMDKNEELKIKIYSFCSTAAINLSSLRNIECFFLFEERSNTKLMNLVDGLGVNIYLNEVMA